MHRAYIGVRACVRACVRAFVRACVRAWVCGCVGARVRGCAGARVRGCVGVCMCVLLFDLLYLCFDFSVFCACVCVRYWILLSHSVFTFLHSSCCFVCLSSRVVFYYGLCFSCFSFVCVLLLVGCFLFLFGRALSTLLSAYKHI